jgi:hypothetical protein
VAAVGLVVGLILGILYGWVINPVEWVDASPAHLRADQRVDYLRMAVESYSVNRDADLAVQRYEALGASGPETLAQLGADPAGISPTAIQNFSAVVEIFREAATPEGTSGPAALSATRLILPVCGATIVLGALLAGAIVLRGRLGRRSPVARQEVRLERAGFAGPPAREYAAAAGDGDKTPLATFRTIYSLGDDLYDDSFSIEGATGDFLGECGVGIGDLIGVGEPKKVSAFEVWLFDKNDIQTVTKVLMGRYSFNDAAARTRLAAKGDPVLAEGGAVLYLETASLQVEARIVDMAYGEGALPPESFFERVTIELRAFQRGAG